LTSILEVSRKSGVRGHSNPITPSALPLGINAIVTIWRKRYFQPIREFSLGTGVKGIGLPVGW
jgi:hypothetical protein